MKIKVTLIFLIYSLFQSAFSMECNTPEPIFKEDIFYSSKLQKEVFACLPVDNYPAETWRILRECEEGAWFIRPSRVKDAPDMEIYVRTISQKKSRDTVQNTKILSIKDYGFCVEVGSQVDTISTLDGFDPRRFKLRCFKEFNALLMHLAQSSLKLELLKYYECLVKDRCIGEG